MSQHAKSIQPEVPDPLAGAQRPAAVRGRLRIEGLHAAYPDGTVALRGVDLVAGAGETVALLGPNGSGKTSLLLAVMGALPATVGRVVVDDIQVGPGQKTLNEVRRRCGMVFQEADDQLFMPTLLEDVAFGPLNHGLSGQQAAAAARRALADVGLAGMEAKSGHHLSAGLKRAAALASVLSMEVGILLLDEPTSNLDARGRRRVVDSAARRSETILLATHDLAVAAALCGRAVVLDNGQVVAQGPCQEILQDASLLQAHGLSCPF